MGNVRILGFGFGHRILDFDAKQQEHEQQQSTLVCCRSSNLSSLVAAFDISHILSLHTGMKAAGGLISLGQSAADVRAGWDQPSGGGGAAGQRPLPELQRLLQG